MHLLRRVLPADIRLDRLDSRSANRDPSDFRAIVTSGVYASLIVTSIASVVFVSSADIHNACIVVLLLMWLFGCDQTREV